MLWNDDGDVGRDVQMLPSCNKNLHTPHVPITVSLDLIKTSFGAIKKCLRGIISKYELIWFNTNIAVHVDVVTAD